MRFIFLFVFACSLSFAAAPPPAQSSAPVIHSASGEGEAAIKRFKLAPGLRAELFAAEPMLANPVAIDVDPKGNVYVSETFRLHAGVTDIRGHMNWLDDDLASRSATRRVGSI